ncbi:hypothetical protein KJ819_03215 [Patescibacteria group bacterium]|nr:hypothetical protein [Patescibacteria group bacterium]MBU1500673.1 hypothetical protein [Patescibacteria group bacterium]MBU2080774.1 hypothetical protein [Patescibacteria group bacterium]MBU2123879.1 hypothetical protein [Patescibacteria group bacterium]MBU2194830.1 hypothetical protein [Patescibacteria group bacterium]
MKYGTLALLCAFGVALSGGVIQAQTLNTGTSLDVNVGADSDSTDVSGSVDTSTTANTSDEDTSTEDTSTTSAQAEGILNFSLVRDSLDASASGDVMVQSASEVSSNDSFRAYAENSLKSDAQFEGVVMNENGMDITYMREARFLAVIPSQMSVRVHVDDNGAVSVKYPWYSFLMATGESQADLEARIASEIASVNNDASATASADMATESENSAMLESQRWARILEKVQVALSANASAQASS